MPGVSLFLVVRWASLSRPVVRWVGDDQVGTVRVEQVSVVSEVAVSCGDPLAGGV
jgi:hypothetical protein